MTSPNAPSAREVLEVALASCPHDVALVDYALDSLTLAGYAIAPEGEHVLIVEEIDGVVGRPGPRRTRWAMEHTLTCRERGLQRCELSAMAIAGAWEGLPSGRYRLVALVADVVAERMATS